MDFRPKVSQLLGCFQLELMPLPEQEAGQVLPPEAQTSRASRVPEPLAHLFLEDKPRALDILICDTQAGIVASPQKGPLPGAPSLTRGRR